ncbi:MAG: formamidopyrimidine-DNA glycosylase [Geobacteraceae bacterium GWC2_58_44]|nr:MAG: formamidopyrimidine-DNA glycosylase [Geobacteraceae bacterium GWC2_58_44]HBG06953.1 formamidopyrimidine-DNA glycosylase [Geobacter sp.]
MPELPDLTVFAENLSKAVVGKKIVRAKYHPKKRLNVSPERLSDSLIGSKLAKVQRVGKEICFTTSNGDAIFIHLMLSGGFVLTTEKQVEDIDYPVLTICFADGSAMAVTDPKGWVMVALNRESDATPDALSITAEYLKSNFEKKPRALVKSFLLDQHLIGGVGNAYSDEILWRARISPKSEVGKLPPEAVKSLLESIPAVLNEAIDYLRRHHADMVSGEFREFLKVHNPSLKKSPTGSTIIKEQILSKKTYYTNEQKLYR